MWAATVAVVGALTALIAWSCWQRWQLLAGSPFPLGVDGYFYPIELRSLLAHGELQYPASPLAFYLLAPFAAITDPITGAKLGAAVIGAAIAVPAYGAGARLGGCRGAGLIAAVLATTSVGSAYLTIEFVKNSVGLTVALTALWLVLRAIDRPTRLAIAAATAGLAAAYATHKMAAALVLVVAIPAVLTAATAHRAGGARRVGIVIVGLAAIAIAVVAIGWVFPRRVLSVGDAQLIRGLWSQTPHWTAPALVSPAGELAIGHDALLGLALGLVALSAQRVRRLATRPAVRARVTAATRVAAGAWNPVARRFRRAAAHAPRGAAAGDPAVAGAAATRPADDAPDAAAAAPAIVPAPLAITAAGWPIVVLAIAIGLPFLAVTDRQGLGFRLRLAAFVPAALTAAIVARDLLGRCARRDRVLAALAVVLAVARQPGDRLDGEVVTHPALVTAAQALNGQVPPGATLIVPERHIAFLVAWYTGAPVALRPEGVPRAHRFRLLPLHFIGAATPLDHQLMAARAEPSVPPPIGVHPRHPNGLVLVAEPTWDWILAQLPAADRAYFAAWPTI